MEQAQIITPWIGDGTPITNNYRPQLKDNYEIIQRDDVGRSNAGGLPDPANYVVHVTATTATLDAIESDSKYHILWRG